MSDTNAGIFAVSRHRIVKDGADINILISFYGCSMHCKYCLHQLVRKELAVINGVKYRLKKCMHRGRCVGTCPL